MDLQELTAERECRVVELQVLFQFVDSQRKGGLVYLRVGTQHEVFFFIKRDVLGGQRIREESVKLNTSSKVGSLNKSVSLE